MFEVLRQLREETGFLLNGWVLMPDHFHLLIPPEPPEATVRFMQELKKRSAQQIIAALARIQGNFRCRALLARLRLPPPPTVIPIIGCGRDVMGLSMPLRIKSTCKNLTTCTTIP